MATEVDERRSRTNGDDRGQRYDQAKVRRGWFDV
jgi:hypothetical protein